MLKPDRYVHDPARQKHIIDTAKKKFEGYWAAIFSPGNYGRWGSAGDPRGRLTETQFQSIQRPKRTVTHR